MEYNRMLGEFIAKRRKELGLTQKELAAKVGISDKAVSKWETLEANPDISLLVPLSEALQISVEELLKGVAAEPALQTEKNSREAQAAYASDISARRPQTFAFIVLGILSVILGLAIAFLLACVALAITSENVEGRASVMVFFFLALIAIAALFVLVVTKAARYKADLFLIPTEEKELNGYRIYQNLSREEKRVLLQERKKTNCVFLGLYVACAAGILVSYVLGFFYESLAAAICGVVFCAAQLSLLIADIILKEKWFRKNKIVTTKRGYEQIKK